MSYLKAIKLPFTDFEKVMTGIALLSFIGLFSIPYSGKLIIINYTAILILAFLIQGYFIKSINRSSNSELMPTWHGIIDLFEKGISTSIIKAIYAIPLALLLTLGIFMKLFSTTILTNPLGSGIFGIIFVILAVLTIYVSLAAITEYGKQEKFKAAFNKQVWKTAFSIKFIYAILLSIITIIIAVILIYITAITRIIPIILLFTTLITIAWLLGEAVRE